MRSAAVNKRTVFFIAGIMIAALMHMGDKQVLKLAIAIGDTDPWNTLLPFLSSLAFCLNLMIYVFLLFYWIGSLRRRLLPSLSKKYLIAAALMMILYLAERSAKYRIGENDPVFPHILWYLYYIPIIFMPTLFLMTCISMDRSGVQKRFDERILIIPASVLTVLVLTNDLHHLVFGYGRGIAGNYYGASGTYTREAGYYVITAFFIAEFIAGMVILTKINRSLRSVRRVITPFLFLFLMLLLLLTEKFLGAHNLPRPFNPPEIMIFCVLGVLESCVRIRLIPFNENYTGFYESMSLPAVITDRAFRPVYKTSAPVNADAPLLEASLNGPVDIDGDTVLYGGSIRAGYAFYTRDESELRRLNEKLREANELLASENSLIKAGNELKEKLARVESRNRIYSRVSEAMYGKRKQLSVLLDSLRPGDKDFRSGIALASLMIAYIKRSTALILADDDTGTVPLDSLYPAFNETVRYLSYCGISAVVADFENGRAERDTALALYSAFEDICEGLIGSASMMTVAIDGGSLRISADCTEKPEIRIPGVSADVFESEGLYYITVKAGEAE